MNLLHVNDRAGEYPKSWYAATAAPMPTFAPLAGAVRADVCIIGAGYTGLSAALHLAERGLKVVVLEAHRAGFGASGRNGGQVGSGQRLEQGELERIVGRDMARRLWDVGQDAKALVADLIARHAIACDHAPGIVHACRRPSEVAHARANAELLASRYDYAQITPLDRDGLREILPSEAYCGGDLDMGASHLHPLNYALGLARAAVAAGAVICEKSEVIRITPGPRPRATTVAGEVEADHLILAANGYLGNLAPAVASHVMPINNFVLATEPLGPRAADVLRRNVAVADSRFVVNYWHLSADQRLIFGGGESYGYRFPDLLKTVRRPMLSVYPGLADVAITHVWGGTLAITLNRLPYFARPAQGVFSASGYSGHGVAMATLAGRMLAEAVAGDASGFDLMASLPTPRFPGGAALRWPLLVAAMTWFSMRDRLGL
ncbi:NAD(P)/FAD-dependent oxidoreductase [Phaeovulum sp.]|uniref:NAD(P)/FAD-dependent oxidoreductase n=1 Tax=Phaeovulum sp. TaxID=2934796 RepID=UPI00356302C8